MNTHVETLYEIERLEKILKIVQDEEDEISYAITQLILKRFEDLGVMEL